MSMLTNAITIDTDTFATSKTRTRGQILHPDAKKLRDKKRAMKICINGPEDGSFVSKKGTVHGPVVASGKCQRCLDVHRNGSKDRRWP